MVVDVLEQGLALLLHLLCGIQVTGGMGEGIELFEGLARFEELFGMGEGAEPVIGGHDLCGPVGAADLALGGSGFGREQAGSVEVEERRQDVLGEAIDPGGEALRDVLVSEPFTHHRQAFLPSTRALSLLRRARDRVKHPTCSLASSSATR